MESTSLFLTTLLPVKRVRSIDTYVSAGGAQALAKALATPPEHIVAEVKKAGLRGGGGGRFLHRNEMG